MLTAAPSQPHTHRRATLEVRDAPDVLVRVLTTLRRRGCRLVAVDYRVGDRHRDGWLCVDYAPPPRCEHSVAAWLANLVDVTSVEDLPGT
jgi:acetolactate synthase regulatory subunit